MFVAKWWTLIKKYKIIDSIVGDVFTKVRVTSIIFA